MKASTQSTTLVALGLAVLLLVAVVLLLATAAPSVPGGAAAAVGDEPAQRLVLRFGKIPNLSPREAWRLYGELMRVLEKHLDCCEMDLVLTKDYASSVQMLAEGSLDFAWLGTATYVQNRDKVPMEPLVRPIWSGRDAYSGVIFTVEATGIQKLSDLKGRRLAFVDRESASGYIYPAALLAEAGLDLEKDFASVNFLGSHDAVLMGVLLGEYDAGAVFDRAYTTVADRARRMRLRVLAQTPAIPGEPIVAGAHVDPAVAAAVREAFLAVTPEQLSHTRLRDLFGFEPVTRAYYNGVRLPEAR